jgi:methionyl-tRNA formyltransferase
MRIIFFGSDDFAAIHLNQLLESSHAIVAVVTQPDRPKGRGMKVVESPIKTIALSRKIPLLQPETLKDTQIKETLKAFYADLFVVVAYGKILPEDVLGIPKIFCVNVHGSLLPKYRGAAPINWAVINGDDHTGVTVMKMSPILDAGEIILQSKMAIAREDTVIGLRLRMAQMGAVTLMEALDKIENKTYKLIRQDLSKVSYASKLNKELGHVDWKDSAIKIENLVRGLQPWPGVMSSYQGKKFKILSAQVAPEESSMAAPGTIIALKKEGILVSTGKEPLLIRQVQPESGKPMEARSFASGQKISVACLLD